eukprot:3940087-Rhodomonas_salina.1
MDINVKPIVKPTVITRSSVHAVRPEATNPFETACVLQGKPSLLQCGQRRVMSFCGRAGYDFD